MKRHIHIPPGLYDDEAVAFIADRHHATPEEVVDGFLRQEGMAGESPEHLGGLAGHTGECSFQLEDNEMEILRGLTNTIYRLWTEEVS